MCCNCVIEEDKGGDDWDEEKKDFKFMHFAREHTAPSVEDKEKVTLVDWLENLQPFRFEELKRIFAESVEKGRYVPCDSSGLRDPCKVLHDYEGLKRYKPQVCFLVSCVVVAILCCSCHVVLISCFAQVKGMIYYGLHENTKEREMWLGIRKEQAEWKMWLPLYTFCRRYVCAFAMYANLL